MRSSDLAEVQDSPASAESGVRSRPERSGPLWELLVRDAPELEQMTDEEISEDFRQACGEGPFVSHDEVMARLGKRSV